MKPIGSKITGLESLDRKALSLTGLQHGEIGLEKIAEAKQRLLASTPEAVNRALSASLRQWGIGIGGGPGITADTQAGLDAAINAYRLALVPLDEKDLEVLVAEMGVTQAHRSGDMDATEFKVDVYICRLMQFPADCVTYACKKSRQWFPTWFELEQDIIEKLGTRRSTYEHLINATVLTDEQKAATKRAQERDQCRYHIKQCVYTMNQISSEMAFNQQTIERDPESPFNTNRKAKAGKLLAQYEEQERHMQRIRNDKPDHITDEEFDELVASFQPLTQVPRESEKPKPKIKMVRTRDEQIKQLTGGDK